MICDAALRFSKEQVVSSTADSSVKIDCNQAVLTTGINDPTLYLVVVNHQQMAGSSPTLKVELKHSDDDSSYAVCAATAALDGTKLPDCIVIPMPMQHKRYLKVAYTVGGSASTGAKVSAFITKSYDAQTIIGREDDSFQ